MRNEKQKKRRPGNRTHTDLAREISGTVELLAERFPEAEERGAAEDADQAEVVEVAQPGAVIKADGAEEGAEEVHEESSI